MTAGGAWTRAQLADWGVPWPPPKGWKRQLLRRWEQHHGASEEDAEARSVTGGTGMGDGVVTMSTDGACEPNPGPGGWGAVLRYGDHELELYGCEAGTTNNRMELLAAIRALEHLTQPSRVHLRIDSQYVRRGITQWITTWKRNGWMTRQKQQVKNVDLWKRLDAATRRHTVEWFWVKGHSGDPDNERADELAAQGAREAAAEHLAHRLGPGPAAVYSSFEDPSIGGSVSSRTADRRTAGPRANGVRPRRSSSSQM